MLSAGMKNEWSSTRQNLYGDPKHIVCGGRGLFDAIVVLDHTGPSSPRGVHGGGTSNKHHGHADNERNGTSSGKGQWGKFLPALGVPVLGGKNGDGFTKGTEKHSDVQGHGASTLEFQAEVDDASSAVAAGKIMPIEYRKKGLKVYARMRMYV